MSRAARPTRQAPPPAETDYVARFQPWLLAGLVALYVARPLWPSESAARIGDGLPLSMLTLLLAVLWLAAGVFSGKLRVRLAPIDAAVALLIAWCSLAAIYSALTDAPRPACNMLWEWIALGTLYFLTRQLVRSPAQQRALIAIMISLATALAAYGLYQYFVTLPDTRAQYAADPDGLLRREGLWYPSGSVERELFEQRLNSTEPLSTFALANSLAGFLTPWFVATAGIALLVWSSTLRQIRISAAVVLALAVVGGCLLLSKSRSAYLASALGLCAVLFIFLKAQRRIPWRYLLASAGVVLLAVALSVATGALDRQVLSEAPKSLGYRWQYWQATGAMIAEHPLLGVGPGNFGDHYTRFKLASASEEIGDPHNFPLELAATAGLPALLAMLVVLALVLRQSLRSQSNEPRDDTSRHEIHFALAGAGAGLLLALALPWLTGALIEVPLPSFTFLFVLVLAGAAAWLWYPWIIAGCVTPQILSIAALALAINLLAAGGISFPAVAQSFWLLVALGAQAPTQSERTLGRPLVFALWTGAVLLLTAGFVTAYQPAIASQSQMALAQLEPARALEHLQRAAEADPSSSTPYSTLAQLYLQRWRAQPTEDNFQDFAQASNQAIQRRPNQCQLWLQMGDGHLEAYHHTGQRHQLDVAIGAYRQAARLYPNQARQHAKLALALAAAGDLQGAAAEARAAYELDAQTPHADQKLRPEVRDQLRSNGLPPVAPPATTQPSADQPASL